MDTCGNCKANTCLRFRVLRLALGLTKLEIISSLTFSFVRLVACKLYLYLLDGWLLFSTFNYFLTFLSRVASSMGKVLVMGKVWVRY